jgi:hypothetical protein
VLKNLTQKSQDHKFSFLVVGWFGDTPLVGWLVGEKRKLKLDELTGF